MNNGKSGFPVGWVNWVGCLLSFAGKELGMYTLMINTSYR